MIIRTMNKPAVIRFGLAVFGVSAALVASIGPVRPARAQNLQPTQIGDTLITSASRVLMTAMLQYQDKWKLLAELDSMGRKNNVVPDKDKADVESWASAFRKVPDREMAFAPQPIVLPLTLSASGVQMIPVTII